MEIIQLLQQNSHYILFGAFILFASKNQVLSKIYGLESISVQEAFQVFKKKSANTLFLDIRTAWELERGPRIKKAKAIPLSELSKRMHEIKKDNGVDKQIIVVCRSGHRAKSAGIKLKKAGFSDVYVMKGGLIGWQRAEYPVTQPKKSGSFG
jgi:rhodanese-related sulfurtransferase